MVSGVKILLYLELINRGSEKSLRIKTSLNLIPPNSLFLIHLCSVLFLKNVYVVIFFLLVFTSELCYDLNFATTDDRFSKYGGSVDYSLLLVAWYISASGFSSASAEHEIQYQCLTDCLVSFFHTGIHTNTHRLPDLFCFTSYTFSHPVKPSHTGISLLFCSLHWSCQTFLHSLPWHLSSLIFFSCFYTHFQTSLSAFFLSLLLFNAVISQFSYILQTTTMNISH